MYPSLVPFEAEVPVMSAASNHSEASQKEESSTLSSAGIDVVCSRTVNGNWNVAHVMSSM